MTCRTCHEAIVPARGTTRNGYAHAGGSDHDVDLIDADVAPYTDVVVESEESILRRGRRAAELFGLPPVRTEGAE